MRKTIRTTAAVLAFPVLINAVALSDMTPRAQNLPPACNSLYTAQIQGCTSQDWQSQQCSPACSNAMEALVAPMQKACGGQGLTGQNLVVAYLAGVGPQQLCHNLKPGATTGSPTTAAQTTTQRSSPTPVPIIVSSSTSTASSATNTKTLAVDSSSTVAGSSTSSKKTTAKHTKPIAAASSSAYTSSSEAASTTTKSRTTTSPASQTTSAAGSSQNNFNDHSGGGSPFDTAGNLINAASELSTSMASVLLPVVVAALFSAVR